MKSEDVFPLRLWRRRLHIAYAFIVVPMLAAYLFLVLGLNLLSDTAVRAKQVRQEYERLIRDKTGK